MLRVARCTPFAALITLGLAGCQDPARPSIPTALPSVVTAEPAPLVPRLIAPQATDPAIDWIPPVNPNCSDPRCNDHHVWLDASRPSNGKLFVLMPGVAPPGPRPRAYQLVQQEAARLGYHVIGLLWQNNVGPGGCTGSPDPECFGNVRLEMIDGVDRSGLVNVSPANSIHNRLTKLLRYLDAQFPAEGWSRFLHKGEPKWSQIAVGGHSGGASQAALIGKLHHVDRVVMVAGPANEFGPSAAWLSIGATPVAKYFALAHQRDQRAGGIRANIDALDLDRFGDPVVPELGEPPYGGTHILTTDLEPTGGYGMDNPHLSVAVDAWTPRALDGTPLLRDAWRYLLGGGQRNEDDDDEDQDRRPQVTASETGRYIVVFATERVSRDFANRVSQLGGAVEVSLDAIGVATVGGLTHAAAIELARERVHGPPIRTKELGWAEHSQFDHGRDLHSGEAGLIGL